MGKHQTSKRSLAPRTRRVTEKMVEQSHWQVFVKEQIWRVGKVGHTLRALRLYHGYSQIKLADAVGIGQSILSRLECGKLLPHPSLALKLAEVLQCESQIFST